MIRKALVAGFAALVCASAAQAGTGFYAGADAGVNEISRLNDGPAVRGAAGYLLGGDKFNYGLEVGFTGFPKNVYRSRYGYKETYSGFYTDLLGVTKYNFGNDGTGFFVMGKGGAAVVEQDLLVTGSSNYKKSVHAVKPEFAVGAGYNVTKNLSVDVTFSHVFGGRVDPYNNPAGSLTRVSAVNTVMAGITYSF